MPSGNLLRLSKLHAIRLQLMKLSWGVPPPFSRPSEKGGHRGLSGVRSSAVWAAWSSDLALDGSLILSCAASMCNLYSETKGRAAIRQVLRVRRDHDNETLVGFLMEKLVGKF